MHWTLTDEQETYRDTLRSWLADVAPTARVRGWLDDGDLRTFWERLAAEGWSGVGSPESAGGQGGGVVELALTAEELGRAAAPDATWLATVLAVAALGGSAGALGDALDGPGAALLVPTEDLPASAPRLAVDDQGRVTGHVPRVLGAATAATYLVVVRRGEDDELRLVRAGESAEGVSATPRHPLDRSRDLADVELAGAPSEPVALEPGGGTGNDAGVAAALDRATDLAGVLVAADSLGATERMLAMAVEYSGQRHQFGVPIGSFQAVKHAAATIEVGVEAARSAVYYAAASVEVAHEEAGRHAAAVKAQVGAAGAAAADSALTIHGAIGYTWEHDLHLFYKRARLDAALFGSPSLWNERLADSLALA
jgi:alkylation response protein AidB-like acyl-CoA dehydrogenase